MTNIDALKPGRELDALVAHKVFQHAILWREDLCDDPLYAVGSAFVVVPPFSTDIAAAWQVVEKFLPHFRLECHEDSDYTDADGWHCDIWTDRGVACAQGADTAPHAICLAALKAVDDA